MKPVLVQADYERAAARLRCTVADIRAVCEVEAPKGGFLPDGQVTILFERHQFWKRTNGRFGPSDINSSQAGGYMGGALEHKRLARAVTLDRVAALESTSWGKFQIMGFNHLAAGFLTLQAFINAMHESEGKQLDAFVSFVLHEKLDDELRENRWADFARRYNGAGYAANAYDVKLAAAHRKWMRAAA